MLGRLLHEDSGKSEQSSALQTQTWLICTCFLHRQGAGIPGPSLHVPIGPPRFFYS